MSCHSSQARRRPVPPVGVRKPIELRRIGVGDDVSWAAAGRAPTPAGGVRRRRCAAGILLENEAEASPEATAKGTPNDSCPSDHIPVHAAFDLASPPALAEADAAALVTKVNAVLARHAEERSETAHPNEHVAIWRFEVCYAQHRA